MIIKIIVIMKWKQTVVIIHGMDNMDIHGFQIFSKEKITAKNVDVKNNLLAKTFNITIIEHIEVDINEEKLINHSLIN